MNPILIGGHRGSGCTDSGFARRRQDRPKPPENTLESFKQAFDEGADFVELDVVRTADNALVVIHSNELEDHIEPPWPRRFVGELTKDGLSKLRTGLGERRGEVPTLASVLDLAAQRRREGRVVLNIEIKDVKGTPALKREDPPLVELLARQVKDHGLLLESVVFSSFAVSDLVELAKLLPRARLGMLFDEPTEDGKPVYPGSRTRKDRYLPFTPENVQYAVEQVRSAGPEARLEFAHPEIRTLTPEALEAASRHGLGLFCWTMKELAPDVEALRETVRQVHALGLGLGFITDFVPEMKRVCAQLATDSGSR